MTLTIILIFLDIDDCKPNPCKNGATCKDRVNGFKCICKPGFNGTKCETSILIKNYLIK